MPNNSIRVHAGNKITTYQNHANFNYLQDIAFMSKAELRKQIELMQIELNMLNANLIKYLEVIEAKNRKILQQQDEILMLYAKQNNTSPLKITA